MIRLPRAPRLHLLLLLCLVAPLTAPRPVVAQGVPAAVPRPELSVFLLTMGQGDQVWEKFGHNAIWVHDPVQGTDRVYNWGVFDFNSPDYWSRFLKGDWLYQLAVDDINETLWQYRYLNRTLVAQELNLSPLQKGELQAFLQWNARPENREYLYDYYRDNCSTRVRDVLDAVLDGQLRASTADQLTETTYRWHSRRLIAEDELAYAGMNAGLGPAADRRITRWEEMFLPGKVQERVRELTVVDDSGARVPLVASEQVLYEAVGRAGERAEPPFRIPVFLLLGLVIGAGLVGLAWVTPRSRAGRFGFAALSSLSALLVGTGGVLLVGLWALTNHTIAHRNENLLQFDPLTLGLVLLAPAVAYGVRWAARPARLLAYAGAALSLLGLVLQLLPGMDQANGEVIALLLPVHLGFALALHRLGRRTPAAVAPREGSGISAPAPAPRRRASAR